MYRINYLPDSGCYGQPAPSSLFTHAVGIQRNDTIIILASEAQGEVDLGEEFNLIRLFGNLTEIERWFWRYYV